jgi:transposase
VSENELPNDIQALKQLVLTLYKDKLQLAHQIEILRRRLFGHRSEKLDPAQLALWLGQAEAAPSTSPPPGESEDTPAQPADSPQPPNPAPPHPKPKRKGHGRRPLPEHLPRQRIEHVPPPGELVCSCGQPMRRFAEDKTEVLEYVPASMVVVEHVRPKYSCPHCQDQVVSQPAPQLPIEQGRPGPGMLAYVLTSKHADHLPLHRLQGILQRYGIRLARSTLCGWVEQAAQALQPIVEEMKRQVLKSPIIQSDDTPVPVLCKGKPHTRRGAMWVYLAQGHVIFEYTPTRAGTGPQNFLSGYQGYLQGDAYRGYDALFTSGKIIEVGCWAHLRRYFVDAQLSEPAYAAQALAWIGQLFKVDRDAREQGLDATARLVLRQQRAGPIVDELRQWIEDLRPRILPKSPLGQALTYAHNQWRALTRFLEDGRLELDNNASERSLRRVAVGRKNWMFAGSDEGARRAAIIYSLVASCCLHGVDPFGYLRDVLERIGTHPARRIQELLPKAWADNAQQVNTHQAALA